MSVAPLKLYARGEEDINVISALLQDAVAQLGDMQFLADENRFVILFNRFCWEREDAALRVRSAMQLANVVSIRQKKLNPARRDGVVSLLAVGFEAKTVPAGEICLHFAGGGEIRLAVEACEAILEDITAPWAAKARPAHNVDE